MLGFVDNCLKIRTKTKKPDLRKHKQRERERERKYLKETLREKKAKEVGTTREKNGCYEQRFIYRADTMVGGCWN